jgi:carboxymethylenebutenolidase
LFFCGAETTATALSYGPVAQVEAMKAALAEAKKPAEFKIYPGAPHGFHADYRPSYRKEAADDAWNQMQAWFRKYKVLG